jgi:hypothetical protein
MAPVAQRCLDLITTTAVVAVVGLLLLWLATVGRGPNSWRRGWAVWRCVVAGWFVGRALGSATHEPSLIAFFGLLVGVTVGDKKARSIPPDGPAGVPRCRWAWRLGRWAGGRR